MAKQTCATKHSVERLKERAGLDKKKAEKYIRLAKLHGKRFVNYKGKSRQYLLKAVCGNAYGLVFRGYCYVFSTYTGKCITVFKLPAWWNK